MNASALEHSKHELATQVLQSWGTLKLRVNGASMIPTLWPGDILTLQSQNFEQTEPGNLVLYARDGRFIVHRAVRKATTEEGEFLITRGDCVAQEDAPVSANALLGRVIQIQRDRFLIALSPQLSSGCRILASLLCRWDLLRSVILRLRVRSAEVSAGTDFAMMQRVP